MKKTTVQLLKREDKKSYGIQVTKWDDEKFVIPVIDIRDGENEMRIANQILKSNKQSKFMKPTFSGIGKSYQVSQKK